MREKIHEILTDKGYSQLENGSYVNTDVECCVIIIESYPDDYNDLSDDSPEMIELEKAYTIRDENDKHYRFSKKSTILMILDESLDKDAIRLHEFQFMKIFMDDIDSIPSINIGRHNVNFLPIGSDVEFDYIIDSNQYFMLVLLDYMKFLNNTTKDVIVGYPKIMKKGDEFLFFRYMTNKICLAQNLD